MSLWLPKENKETWFGYTGPEKWLENTYDNFGAYQETHIFFIWVKLRSKIDHSQKLKFFEGKRKKTSLQKRLIDRKYCENSMFKDHFSFFKIWLRYEVVFFICLIRLRWLVSVQKEERQD